MFDISVRKKIDPALNEIGQRLANQGVSANQVTIAGFVIGCFAAWAIAGSWFWTGLVLLLLSRLCDGLDGAVARAGKNTDFGGFLDIVLDFAFYGLIPLAFIVAEPESNAIAGGVLLLTFYVNGASFLAYSVMAEKRGIEEDDRGTKSLLYTTGLAEATETICVFVLFCLLPQWFSLIAWALAAIVAYTTFSRIMLAKDAFK